MVPESTSAALETLGDEAARPLVDGRHLLDDLLHVVGVQRAHVLVGMVDVSEWREIQITF